MTKKEIILETIEYYQNNPRSITGTSTCLYLSGKGYKCAFSRCCTDEGVKTLHERFEGKSVGDAGMDYESFLEDKYKGHSEYFWGDIQRLHDCDISWDGNTLTVKGKDQRDEFLEKYKDN